MTQGISIACKTTFWRVVIGRAVLFHFPIALSSESLSSTYAHTPEVKAYAKQSERADSACTASIRVEPAEFELVTDEGNQAHLNVGGSCTSDEGQSDDAGHSKGDGDLRFRSTAAKLSDGIELRASTVYAAAPPSTSTTSTTSTTPSMQHTIGMAKSHALTDKKLRISGGEEEGRAETEDMSPVHIARLLETSTKCAYQCAVSCVWATLLITAVFNALFIFDM